jgi:Growth inhibitor
VDVVKAAARTPSRGEVFLVDLDPARGSKIRKTRPCVVVSPDELNHHLRTSIVAPMTTGGHSYPFRIPCRFAGKAGHVVLDQLRTVDHERFRKRLGALPPATVQATLRVLGEMFEP